jgi:monoglucosyldiacylglycerol epimerase
LAQNALIEVAPMTPLEIAATLGIFALQAGIVFVGSTLAFDTVHYLLHRWKRSRIKLLRHFARMHDVHHRFLTPRMQINEKYRWTNIWAHVLPEFLTSLAGTLAFLLVLPWQPVAAIAAVRVVLFLVVLKEEGMDFNHMSMDRVGGRQGVFWVSPRYHAMHHIFPSNFYSSAVNVFDLVMGTTCQIKGRNFLVTGASGAFGSEIIKRIEKLGGKVETAKFGTDYAAGEYRRLEEKLHRADVLVLAHGAKHDDCWNANYRTFVDLIDRFIEIGKGRLTAPEVWALGSEAELHGDLGIADWKDYAASKRAFAARARSYHKSRDLVYRHVVPSAFTSSMGRGLMSARTAAAMAMFFIRRNFTYVPVTFTTLALWNYFRFILQPEYGREPTEAALALRERGGA